MKKYIFITYSTKRIGGVQCYVAAKANYLEKNGWMVHVFCPGLHSSKYPCPISSLNKYLNDGLITLLGMPPYKLPTFIVDIIINKMKKSIGPTSEDDDIIIETHDDCYSQWGELLASCLGARHYFYTMHEFYRGKDQYYKNKIDFYFFKFKRREILGALSTFNRLFEGYMEVTQDEIVGEMWIDESPIQDVYCEKIEKIVRSDYNVCYIGRGTKSYVSSILADVGTFASNHKDKTVQLLTVSDLESHRDLIKTLRKDNPNLIIHELGLLHPIPKSLYSKIDVVIAGAGSARHSCEEGALTIVADTETCKSNGLLGYETLDSVFCDENSVVTDFCEALERALIKKIYKGRVCKYPAKKSFAESTKHNFSLYEKSERKKEYYNPDLLMKGKVDMLLIIRRYISDYYPKFVKFANKYLGIK